MDDRDSDSMDTSNTEGTGNRQTQARRGPDRRVDGGGLFGGYSGPERRSGRDRRNG